MNENDMNNLMNQINQMLKNNDIPEDLKNIVNSLKDSSNNSNNNSNSNGLSNNDADENNSESPDFDINTMLKMKQIMDSIKSSKNDPRANLLLSLKPYLKESRKEKVDQYVKLFGLEKAFETFSSLGGEKKHDV